MPYAFFLNGVPFPIELICLTMYDIPPFTPTLRVERIDTTCDVKVQSHEYS